MEYIAYVIVLYGLSKYRVFRKIKILKSGVTRFVLLGVD